MEKSSQHPCQPYTTGYINSNQVIWAMLTWRATTCVQPPGKSAFEGNPSPSGTKFCHKN